MKPEGCICPNEGYVCKADHVTKIILENKDLAQPLTYDIEFSSSRPHIITNGLIIYFFDTMLENGKANLTAEMFIIDKNMWNGSTFTCQVSGEAADKNITVCVRGKHLKPQLFVSINNHRSCLISHWSVSGVEHLISSGQFPVSSVWRRVCGVLCGHCCQ